MLPAELLDRDHLPHLRWGKVSKEYAWWSPQPTLARSASAARSMRRVEPAGRGGMATSFRIWSDHSADGVIALAEHDEGVRLEGGEPPDEDVGVVWAVVSDGCIDDLVGACPRPGVEGMLERSGERLRVVDHADHMRASDHQDPADTLGRDGLRVVFSEALLVGDHRDTPSGVLARETSASTWAWGGARHPAPERRARLPSRGRGAGPRATQTAEGKEATTAGATLLLLGAPGERCRVQPPASP